MNLDLCVRERETERERERQRVRETWGVAVTTLLSGGAI